jgi:hypothetical protein
MVAIDTPRSLTVAVMIRYEEWDQLTSLSIDPLGYNDLYPERYLLDVQATDFLRKCEGFPIPGKDLVSEAEARFFSLERENKRTNDRLGHILYGSLDCDSDLRILEFFEDVKRVTGAILGSIPESIDLKHGPGATFYDRVPLTTVPDKMSSRPAMTRHSTHLLPLYERSAWGRAVAKSPHGRLPIRTVRGDRFTTVPKDARKRRGICVQPSLNVAYQLGIGRYMRSRLKRFGLDLDDGQKVHRRVACESSLSGDNATIDLSDASDTICKNLVRLCLPAKWYELLWDLRTHLTRVGQKWVLLEKFSAMGNGFTFELETLIFAAISLVASKLPLNALGGAILVYGDDIIAPTIHASSILSALRFSGFRANEKKTFVTGSFRESCGGDFLKGVAVRPHFLKEFPSEPQHIISLANGIRRFFRRLEAIRPGFEGRFKRVWFYCLDRLPSNIRQCRGPDYLGDIAIHDESDRWSFLDGDNQVRSYRVYVPVPTILGWEHWRGAVVMASALYGSDTEGVSFRGGISGYRIGWTPALESSEVVNFYDKDTGVLGYSPE